MKQTEYYLLWLIRIGLGALLLTPFIVTGTMYFPFVTGKNFFFRIITEIIFAAWAALAVLHPDYRPRRSPMLLALIAFTGAITLATIFGVDPYHSFWSNLERMEGLLTHLHLLALFLVVGHTVRSKKEWTYVAHGFAGVGLIVSLHAILQFTGILDIVGVYRPYATFGNSIYLAGYLIFSIFLSSLLFAQTRISLSRWIYGIAIVLQGFAFFVAASRGAFIGFVVGAIASLVALSLVYKNRTYRLATSGAFALCVLVAVLIFIFPSSAIVQRVELFSRLSSVSIDSLDSDPRIIVWKMAIDSFKDRPLLGWGPENFIVPFGKFYNPALYGNEPWFDRTHNMFLEWLVAGGIVGFAAYITLFVIACWMIRRLVSSKRLVPMEGILLTGMFVAYAIQNAFVFDNIVSYLAIMFFYAFLHAQYNHENVRTESVRQQHSNIVIIISLTAASALVLVYSINMRPILAAQSMNTAMQALTIHQPVEQVIAAFDKVIDYRSFVTTESREQMSEAAIRIITAGDNPSTQALTFLQKAIVELKAEQADHSQNPRYPLFLG
ncbi:MAG: O-antigen ligase family protein, partial [Patescibacteria group bacterium]